MSTDGPLCLSLSGGSLTRRQHSGIAASASILDGPLEIQTHRCPDASLQPFPKTLGTPDSRKKKARSHASPRVLALKLFLHITSCCLAALAGYRFSRESLMTLDWPLEGARSWTMTAFWRMKLGTLDPGPLGGAETVLLEKNDNLRCLWDLAQRWKFADDSPVSDEKGGESTFGEVGMRGSRVGRHGILLKQDPMDMRHVVTVYSLLQLVNHNSRMVMQSLWRSQEQQSRPKNLRRIIAVTPTHKTASQTANLLGLINSLKAAEGRLLWLVVESGNRSAETAALLRRSGLGFVHLSVSEPVPEDWEDRIALEGRMREAGMMYIRRNRLSGVVIFPDDSAVLSPALFAEARKVHWVGGLSVGVLLQQGFTAMTMQSTPLAEFQSHDADEGGGFRDRVLGREGRTAATGAAQSDVVFRGARVPVQGPVCEGPSVAWNGTDWGFPFLLLPKRDGRRRAIRSRTGAPGTASFVPERFVGWHTMLGMQQPQLLVNDMVPYPPFSLLDLGAEGGSFGPGNGPINGSLTVGTGGLNDTGLVQNQGARAAAKGRPGVERSEALGLVRQERGAMLWLGFAINARLLWEAQPRRLLSEARSRVLGRAPKKPPMEIPSWVKRWRPRRQEGESEVREKKRWWVERAEVSVELLGWAQPEKEEGDDEARDPLSMFVTDERKVQTLGDCGRRILAWWVKTEVTETPFHPSWVLEPPLEITFPARKTPWLPAAVPKKKGPPPPTPKRPRAKKKRGKLFSIWRFLMPNA